MSKKKLQLRAIEQHRHKSKKDNLDELAEKIPGQSALCFTNIDIFELKNIFNENEWMVSAKPNEITPVDIWVTEGDTGLPTGQVISELNMTLRLPTKIQNDTIWIREDTRTHSAGDYVNVKQAAVLKKLGVAPIKSLIKIHYAWSDGEIIPEEILYMDIQKAHREALGILFELPVYFDDMRDEYIRKAVSNAITIKAIVLGEDLHVPTKKEEDKKEKAEDDEEEEVGIGGLFGN